MTSGQWLNVKHIYEDTEVGVAVQTCKWSLSVLIHIMWWMNEWYTSVMLPCMWLIRYNITYIYTLWMSIHPLCRVVLTYSKVRSWYTLDKLPVHQRVIYCIEPNNTHWNSHTAGKTESSVKLVCIWTVGEPCSHRENMQVHPQVWEFNPCMWAITGIKNIGNTQ